MVDAYETIAPEDDATGAVVTVLIAHEILHQARFRVGGVCCLGVVDMLDDGDVAALAIVRTEDFDVVEFAKGTILAFVVKNINT